jgi:hypothetical protein
MSLDLGDFLARIRLPSHLIHNLRKGKIKGNLKLEEENKCKMGKANWFGYGYGFLV